MDLSSADPPSQPGTTFSAEDMASLIGRASTLAERLTGEVIPTGQEQALAAKRLDRWKHFSANDGEDGFLRVPGFMGSKAASNEELLSLLGEVLPAPNSGLPRWAALLQEIVPAISAAFSTGEKSRRTDSPSKHRSIPFAALYSPAIALARKKIESTLSRRNEWMRDGAWRGLENWLLERISAVCSLTLQPKFLACQAVRRPGAMLARFDQNPRAREDGGTASLFDAFVDEQGRQGLRDFFLDYPTAARLCAQTVLFWIDFVGEFLGRLDTDHGEISARFLAGRSLGKITRIIAGISDPHRGGRSILVLHFTSGLHLVYKPRPMEIDAAFSELLLWLNTQGQIPPLPSPVVLAKEDHGWETFVAYSPCRNRREARDYFRRAGALLYLFHALRGVDLHRENMIATAEGPVLVDLEALFHPQFSEDVVIEDGAGRRWPFGASVFRTGMIRVPGRRPDGKRYRNLSALDGPVLRFSPATDIRWKHVNSDRMEAAPGSSRMVCKTHRAILRGRLLAMRDYRETLVDGFRRLALFLQNDDHTARRWRAIVGAMNGLKTRVVKRPTFLYMTVLNHSLRPRFLVEGIDRSIELLALPSTVGDEEIRRAELAALEVLDVPVFFGPADTDLSGDVTNLASQVAAIRASAGRRRRGRSATK